MADEGIYDEDDVVFLSVDQVVSLHEEAIRRFFRPFAPKRLCQLLQTAMRRCMTVEREIKPC